MATYNVTVHETIVHVFKVEADTAQDAEYMAGDARLDDIEHFSSSAAWDIMEAIET